MKTKAKVPEGKAAAQRRMPADALARANKLIDEIAPIVEQIGECEYEVSDLVSPLLFLATVGDDENVSRKIVIHKPDGEEILMSSSMMAMGKTLKIIAWRLHVCSDALESLKSKLESKLKEYLEPQAASAPQ